MDRRITPEEERKFQSPNGKIVLVVATLDHWKTREPIASLFEGKKELWKMKLPHSHGPRAVSVTNSGVVVIFDEWINIASDHAVSVISKSGRKNQVWSYKDVQTILEVTNAKLTSTAKFGPWMSSMPWVSGDLVQIQAAGMILTVDTKTNRISK